MTSSRHSANQIATHIEQFHALERKSSAYYAYQAIHRFTVRKKTGFYNEYSIRNNDC